MGGGVETNSSSWTKKVCSKLPYPQRQQKHKMNQNFQNFLNIYKKLTINIPFTKALDQMPSYERFMKQILSKKNKMKEFETMALNEEYTTMLQMKLPPKLKDAGRFIIPSPLGQIFHGKRYVIYVLASTWCHCLLIRNRG